MTRVVWLAVPGLMDSSKLAERPVARYMVALMSFAVFILVVIGVVTLSAKGGEDVLILLGTYLALVLLTPYYLIAKVVTLSYFCVLVVACAGALALWDRVRVRVRQYLAPDTDTDTDT